MSAFLANLEKHKEIDACDEAISGAVFGNAGEAQGNAAFLG